MMNSAVYDLIYKYTHKLTVKSVKDGRTIVFVILLILAVATASIKSYVAAGILALMAIGACIFLSILARINTLTIYGGVCFGLFLFGTLVVGCNVMLHIVQKQTESYYGGIYWLVIIMIETFCLFCGLLYSIKKVEKGNVKKLKSASVPTAVYYICAGLGYFIARIVAGKASPDTKNLFFVSAFVIFGSLFMFFVGMTYLSIIYYIRKYRISDRPIENTQGE